MKISLETRDKNNLTYSKSLLVKEKIHMISEVSDTVRLFQNLQN